MCACDAFHDCPSENLTLIKIASGRGKFPSIIVL